MAAVTICSDSGAQENKICHCFHFFPFYFSWNDRTRCHDVSFLNVALKPTFSLSSFTFIKRLFSSSSLSAIRQIDGEEMETVTVYISLGSKVTADGECSHEIKRRLLLGRKVMTHLGSILKSRDITLPTKVHLVKAMVFPVVMWCESWTIKKVECWELMLLNCGAGEDSWESLGLQGDQISQL